MPIDVVIPEPTASAAGTGSPACSSGRRRTCVVVVRDVYFRRSGSRRSLGPSYSYEIGSITRIGASRRCSSSACAARPGTREMISSASATSDGRPMSPQTAAMAPSMLIGSERSCERRVARERVLDRADELRVLLIDFELVRDLQQPRRARIDRVVPVAESRRRELARRSTSRSTSTVAAAAIDVPVRASARPSSSNWRQASDVAAVVAARTRARRRPPSRAATRRSSRRCGPPASTAASRRDR